MKYRIRILTKITRLGLWASATAPASGSTALDNSQGASQASAEIMDSLGEVFEDIAIAEDISGQLSVHLERLDDRAARYANSSLDFCTSKEPWGCNRQEAALISLVWNCAADVYNDLRVEERGLNTGTAAKKLNLEWAIPCSPLGSVKATSFSTHIPSAETSGSVSSSPYLIIAVRGSAAKLDHVVNLNSEPRDARALFVDDAPMGLQAHAGFLNSAMGLIPLLDKQIANRLNDMPSSKLIFTGHSAGGATASLLYLAFRSKFSKMYHNATFSCITFGCPPVAMAFSDEDQKILNQITLQDNVINIINEYDLVTRATRGYLRSLTHLYNRLNPPMTSQHVNQNGNTPVEDESVPTWDLPNPTLQHIGPLVVLKTEAPLFESFAGETTYSPPTLSVWKLTSECLAKLIFCRLLVHKRIAYSERVQQLEKGFFNGKKGWVSGPGAVEAHQ